MQIKSLKYIKIYILQSEILCCVRVESCSFHALFNNSDDDDDQPNVKPNKCSELFCGYNPSVFNCSAPVNSENTKEFRTITISFFQKVFRIYIHMEF